MRVVETGARFVEGDHGVGGRLRVTWPDELGRPIPLGGLAGLRVTLRFRYGNESMQLRAMNNQGAPNDHIAEYRFQPGELKAGWLIYDIVITDPASGLSATSNLETRLFVRARKPSAE